MTVFLAGRKVKFEIKIADSAVGAAEGWAEL